MSLGGLKYYKKLNKLLKVACPKQRHAGPHPTVTIMPGMISSSLGIESQRHWVLNPA
jgi:hypothetical protein